MFLLRCEMGQCYAGSRPTHRSETWNSKHTATEGLCVDNRPSLTVKFQRLIYASSSCGRRDLWKVRLSSKRPIEI